MNKLQVFASLVKSCHDEETNSDTNLTVQFIESHLKQMVEVAFRAQRYLHGPDPTCVRETKEAASLLLDQLERLVRPSLFIGVTTEMQQMLDKNKAQKKMKEKVEYTSNPKLYAMKKVHIFLDKIEYKLYSHVCTLLLHYSSFI